MPLKIVFISCVKNAKRFWLDPSYRYRCENLGLALKKIQHQVEFQHLHNSLKTPQADIVVFHRPRNTWRFRWLLHRLRRRKTFCIADVDDLVFDPAMAKFSPGVINQQHPLETIQALFLSHYDAYQCFDHITVSTAPLKEHIQQLFPEKHCKVIPNGVHESWKQLSENSRLTQANTNERIITYLPGTASHDRDFLGFSDALSNFLVDNSEIKLEITGPLSLPGQFPESQIITRDRVAFEQYHRYLRHGWVNLMPLEKTPFTRCKSALKVIEAGYWNIPTIASINPDTKRFLHSGACLVNTPDEVYSKLEQLKNPTSYEKVTRSLRSKIGTIASADHNALLWIDFIRRESSLTSF